MPALELPWAVFGRKVRPVSLGLLLLMLTYAAFGLILDAGAFGSSEWGDITGAAGLLAAGGFVLAFWQRSQQINEMALALSFAVMLERGLSLLFIDGWTSQSAWSTLWVGLIAGGSWVYERLDPDGLHLRGT